MADDRRFSFRVAADDAAIWSRIVADPRVRVSDAPAPEPAPPLGPVLLASREPARVRVRHWAGPADASSPIVVLELSNVGAATLVEGHIEQPQVSRPFGEPPARPGWFAVLLPSSLLLAIAALAYVLGGSTLLWALPLLLVLFAIPASLVMLPMLALWNAEVRREQRRALREWVGETFVPIALPADGHDEPFR